MHWFAAVVFVCLAGALAALVSWLAAGRPSGAGRAPAAVERVVFGQRKRAKQTDGDGDRARPPVVATSAGLRYGLVPDERAEVAVVRRASLRPREEGEVPFEGHESVWRADVTKDGAVSVVRRDGGGDGGGLGTYSFGRRWRDAAVADDSRLLAAVAEDDPSRVHLYRRDVLHDDAFEPWTTLETGLPVAGLRFALESFMLLLTHDGGAVRAYRMPERTKGASPRLAYADASGDGAPPVRGLLREPGRLVLLS